MVPTLETTLDAEFDLLIESAYDTPIPCESTQNRCRQKGPHEAHWWAHSPCGSIIPLCAWRRLEMRRNGSWMCNGHWESWDQIEWVPIQR